MSHDNRYNDINIPRRLQTLLRDSVFDAPLRQFVDRTAEIINDNKLPFFPDYTDHGRNHISDVLRAESELIPAHVWTHSQRQSKSPLLGAADAAVLIAATVLHDLAMHLRPHGFLELISKPTRFKPLISGDHSPLRDEPWSYLWHEYVHEVRRFSARHLCDIIGETSVGRGWTFTSLPDSPSNWETNHYLVVGEFIRRHHARLAHEIAIYGFPGISIDAFDRSIHPLSSSAYHPLNELADLIGLTARSHGLSLRQCHSHLMSHPIHGGTPRPLNVSALYLMALLRVADYMQIDKERTPTVLLKLRRPQSPASLREWQRHLSVLGVTRATDPAGVQVVVSSDITLGRYLQLRELITLLQKELDECARVLSEAYGPRDDMGLDRLTLQIKRVYSNLHDDAFRRRLPYVPIETAYSVDAQLITLMTRPLYGDNPGIGVRELIQNAVDAVWELRAWCQCRNIARSKIDSPNQEADVLVDFIKKRDGTWLLRVRDKGIGMTSSTIRKYFLRAGASFRNSTDWMRDFTDGEGRPIVPRAGRFGIGVFAIFLLGPKFTLSTRHVGAPRDNGYIVEAASHSRLIELTRAASLPVGTTVEVALSPEAAENFFLSSEWRDWARTRRDGPNERVNYLTDWYCWRSPSVFRRVVWGREKFVLRQRRVIPAERRNPAWPTVRPAGFKEVSWSWTEPSSVVCNGLRVETPGIESNLEPYEWPAAIGLRAPAISVVERDSALRRTERQ